MDLMLLRLFQHHVKEQCVNALVAAGQINDALAHMQNADNDFDEVRRRWKRARDQRTEAMDSMRSFGEEQELDRAFRDAQQRRSEVIEEGGDHLWRSIQAFAVSTANLSKLLWGQKARRATARESLRNSIGVSDASPLRGATTSSMRNNFEHIDERLETWFADDPQHGYIDRIVGPPGMIGGVSSDKSFFRGFDPSTGELRFWGETFDLPAIVDEVRRILPVVAAEAAKPHWEP